MGQINEFGCSVQSVRLGIRNFGKCQSAVIVFTAAVLKAVWQSILHQTYCCYSVGLLQVLKTPQRGEETEASNNQGKQGKQKLSIAFVLAGYRDKLNQQSLQISRQSTSADVSADSLLCILLACYLIYFTLHTLTTHLQLSSSISCYSCSLN